VKKTGGKSGDYLRKISIARLHVANPMRVKRVVR
jgi:hypothetical protein